MLLTVSHCICQSLALQLSCNLSVCVSAVTYISLQCCFWLNPLSIATCNSRVSLTKRTLPLMHCETKCLKICVSQQLLPNPTSICCWFKCSCIVVGVVDNYSEQKIHFVRTIIMAVYGSQYLVGFPKLFNTHGWILRQHTLWLRRTTPRSSSDLLIITRLLLLGWALGILCSWNGTGSSSRWSGLEIMCPVSNPMIMF